MNYVGTRCRGYLTSYFDHEVQQSQLNWFLPILGSGDKNLNNGIFENSPSSIPEGARSGDHESTGTLESFRSEFAVNL